MSDAERAYRLAVAIMGGEDAPGYADSVETAVLEKMARDAAEEGHRFWASALAAHGARIEKLERALRPFCFFGDEPDTTQEAWEIRYRDRFQDWIDFQDIEAARAVMGPQP